MGFGAKNHGRGVLWCVFLLLAAGGVLLASTVASAAGTAEEGPAATATAVKAEGSSSYDACVENCNKQHYHSVIVWSDCIFDCKRHALNLAGRVPENNAAADARRLGRQGKTVAAAGAIREVV